MKSVKKNGLLILLPLDNVILFKSGVLQLQGAPDNGTSMKKKSSDKVTVARGVKVARGTEEKMRKKKGSSNAGIYKSVSPGDFAGASGGASKYSFPINTIARARNALARAHFAPDPEGIKRAVYRKYPELKKRAQERKSHGKK